MELWVSLFIAGAFDQLAAKGPVQLKKLNDPLLLQVITGL